MKLRHDQSVIIWEFWSEAQHVNVADGILRVAVKPHSVKTFRITAIDQRRTALVGSSFHHTMGAMEIAEWAPSGQNGLTVRVVRPSAEEGCCAFWSAQKQSLIVTPVKTGPDGVSLTIA